jgi:hypothetical protein
MSERIDEPLNRNLQEVFGEGDAARRRAAIEELYANDCAPYVPPQAKAGDGWAAEKIFAPSENSS